VDWFNRPPGLPNDTEVLFLALLVAACGKVSDVTAWAALLAPEAPRFTEQGSAWEPSDSTLWKGPGSQVAVALKPLLAIYSGLSIGKELLATVAKALQGWEHGGGARDDLGVVQLRNYLDNPPEDFKPRGWKKKGGPPRWQGGMAAQVAELVKRHGPALRKALKLDVPLEELPTLVGQAREIEALQEKLAFTMGKLDTARGAHYKSAARLKTKNGKCTKAQREKREKSKAADRSALAVLKLNVRASGKRTSDQRAVATVERLELKYGSLSDLLLTARKRKKIDKLSESRLVKLKAAKETIDDLRVAFDEARDEASDDLQTRQADVVTNLEHAAAYAKIQAMPKWRPGCATGRGGVQFDFDYRVAIFSQFSNGTPMTAIGDNILSVVRLTAPWIKAAKPSRRFFVDTRFELRTVVESLAARQAASAYRIRMLGSDETIKFGDPAITSNLLIEPLEGDACEVVILRGVYCSAGGTAEAVSSAIETKCFARLRDFLRRWEKTFRRLNPSEPWTGPDAAQLSLGRLAGGGAI
jgi:hypothetical protein